MRKQFNEILKIVGVIFLGSFILGGLLTFGARYIRFDQKTSMFEIGDKTKIKGDLYVDGKVGIGTEQPEYRLTADDQKNSDRAAQVFNGKFFGTWIGSQQKDRKHYALNVLTGTTGAGKGGTSALYVRTDGNVGIGTEEPKAKLEVVGNIITQAPIEPLHAATKKYVDTKVETVKAAVEKVRYCITISEESNVDCPSGSTALLSTKGKGCEIKQAGKKVIVPGGMFRIRISDRGKKCDGSHAYETYQYECLDAFGGGSWRAIESAKCEFWENSTVALCCF